MIGVELAEIFAICADERKCERERLRPIMTQIYDAGYQAGRNDVMNGNECSADHADVVAALLDELLDD